MILQAFRQPLSRLIMTYVGLILLGAVFVWGKYLSLFLLAASTAVLIFILGRKSSAWLWAAVGTSFWAGSILLNTLSKLSSQQQNNGLLFNVLYVLGAMAWFIALQRLPFRLWDRRVFFAVPVLVPMIYLLVQDVQQTLLLIYPFLDLLLFIYALPLVAPSFRRRIFEGRILLVLGLFIRAVTSGLYVWLGMAQTEMSFYLLWTFSYSLIALGAWLELHNVKDSLWPLAYTLLGFGLTVGIGLALVSEAQLTGIWPLIFIAFLISYSLLLSIFLLFASDRGRRSRSEQELREWSLLLARLTRYKPSPKQGTVQPQILLKDMLRTLKEFFPNLRGIEVNVGKTLGVGRVDGYAYPLVADGTELGHLYFQHQPQGTRVLDVLSHLLTNQLEYLLLQEEWREQTVTDPLTGLLNRRGLSGRGERLMRLACKHGRPVSIAVLDLDYFKRVNDLYGHAVGDEALKVLALILKEHIRKRDLAVRWGGEEFVLFLFGADLDTALQVVERIRSALKAKRITPINRPLTLSAGIVGGVIPEGVVLTDWLDEADQALLYAKDSGRDRVEVPGLMLNLP